MWSESRLSNRVIIVFVLTSTTDTAELLTAQTVTTGYLRQKARPRKGLGSVVSGEAAKDKVQFQEVQVRSIDNEWKSRSRCEFGVYITVGQRCFLTLERLRIVFWFW